MMKKLLFLVVFITLYFVSFLEVNATDKYDGKYSIEYLIRNYNVVTLGQKDVHLWSKNAAPSRGGSGSVSHVFDIGGPVLINGDYISSSNIKYYANEFAQKTLSQSQSKNIDSYITGKIGENISPGSREAHEVSNVYVSSLNQVNDNQINGNANSYQYPIIQSDNYLDFSKLYAAILNEANSIDKGNPVPFKEGSGLTIEEPGNYYISDIGRYGVISIENYDPDGLYIINYYGRYVYSFPRVYIKSSDYHHPNGFSVYCGRTSDNDSCAGNIIWNMPNARYIEITYPDYDGVHTYDGHLIAPKADVNLPETHYEGAFVVNSLNAPVNSYTAIQYKPYNIDKTFTTVKENKVLNEPEDDPSDFYEGGYSIDELLRNYSIVSLGQKDYSDKATLKGLTDVNGTVSLSHIAGQYLINGNLGVADRTYINSDYAKGIRVDHYFSDITNYSYVKGKVMSNIFYDKTRSDTFKNDYFYSGSYREFVSSLNRSDDNRYIIGGNYVMDNYINFSTLYKNIVKQQKEIKKGVEKKIEKDKVIHLKTGGNYTIKSVSDLDSIIFTDFENNKDKLTVITIEDDGEVNLPVVGYGSSSSVTPTLVSTNDQIYGHTYDDKNEITHEEQYYGNIVWNIPNANYITLAEAPFIGHVIAPNADVETPELHFAGSMIVNSLYSEGRSEAHFYPLETPSTFDEEMESLDNSTKTDDNQKEYTTVLVPDTSSEFSSMIIIISLLLIIVGVRLIVKVLYKKDIIK